jgi:hypothetical protein
MNAQNFFIAYADCLEIAKKTSDIRKVLNELYPNISLIRQLSKAWEDGIVTSEEYELVRQYIILNNGGY